MIFLTITTIPGLYHSAAPQMKAAPTTILGRTTDSKPPVVKKFVAHETRETFPLAESSPLYGKENTIIGQYYPRLGVGFTQLPHQEEVVYHVALTTIPPKGELASLYTNNVATIMTEGKHYPIHSIVLSPKIQEAIAQLYGSVLTDWLPQLLLKYGPIMSPLFGQAS